MVGIEKEATILVPDVVTVGARAVGVRAAVPQLVIRARVVLEDHSRA